VLLIHWTGGRHTRVRVPRVKTGRYPSDLAPAAVDALRKLAGQFPDRELAVSLNRMRCKTGDGETWTTVRVREMRERLGLPEYDPTKTGGEMISLARAAQRLGICVGSAKSLKSEVYCRRAKRCLVRHGLFRSRRSPPKLY